MNAKRIVFRSQRGAVLEDFDLDATLGENELLIKTVCSIISAGTELASFTGLEAEALSALSQVFSYPRYPGYGNVGQVLETGKNVKDFQVGDIVLSTAPHASHAKVDITKSLCVKVPKGLEPLKAVFGRMARVSITAVRDADFSLGDTVLVIGLGLVGNFAAQEFKLEGANLMAADVSDFRLRRAELCGIERTINPSKADLKEAVMKWTDGKGARVVVEAVGAPEVIAQSVWLTGRDGQVILLGSPRKGTMMNVTPMLLRIHTGGIVMKGAHEWRYSIREGMFLRHSYTSDLKQILEWIRSGALKTEPLLTHILPPEKCQQAYEGLENRKEEYLSVVFDWR